MDELAVKYNELYEKLVKEIEDENKTISSEDKKETTEEETTDKETSEEEEEVASNEKVLRKAEEGDKDELNAKLFSLKVGDAPTFFTIENSAFYVAVRNEFTDEHVKEYYDSALSDLKSEDFETFVTETLQEKATIVVNEDAVDYYKPENITTILG